MQINIPFIGALNIVGTSGILLIRIFRFYKESKDKSAILSVTFLYFSFNQLYIIQNSHFCVFFDTFHESCSVVLSSFLRGFVNSNVGLVWHQRRINLLVKFPNLIASTFLIDSSFALVTYETFFQHFFLLTTSTKELKCKIYRHLSRWCPFFSLSFLLSNRFENFSRFIFFLPQ